MKKKLLAMILCFMLTSCSSNKTTPKKSQTVEFDFTCAQSFSDSGMVYLDGDILHFTDIESGLDTVICSKAECSHESESHNNTKPVCNGWVEGINTYCPMIVDDKLYFLYTPDNKAGNGYGGFLVKRLCQANKDGTNRRDIAELHGAEMITDACYDNGKLVVGYRSLFDDSGNSLEKSRSFVSVIDLKSGEIYTSDVFEDYQGIINHIWMENDTVYFCNSYTTSEIEFDKWDITSSEFEEYLKNICKADLMSINTKTNEVKTLYSTGNCADVGYGYGLVLESCPKLVNLSDGSVTELDQRFSDCAFTLCSEGVIINNYSENKYHFYSFANSKTTTLNTAQRKFNIYSVTDTLIYVSYESEDDFVIGVMDRADFLNGKSADIRELNVK